MKKLQYMIIAILAIATTSILVYGMDKDKKLQEDNLSRLTAKSTTITNFNVFIHSDSILGTGDFIKQLQQQLDSIDDNKTYTISKSIYPDSHSSIALAQEADCVYIPESSDFNWKEIEINKVNKSIDATLLLFGRNEANDCMLSTSYSRAYDKLISQCYKRSNFVVFGNPPAKQDVYKNQWAPDDKFKSFLDSWDKLCDKWSNSVDVYKLLMRSNLPTRQIMSTAWTQSTDGGFQMAKAFKNKIKNSKSEAYIEPELKNKVKYYLSGMPTGTWELAGKEGFEEKLVGIEDYENIMLSYTKGDFLLFNNITAEQLHLIYYQSKGFGDFEVIVDEGMENEKKLLVNSDLAPGQTEGVIGKIAADFLSNSKHSVKIIITSEDKPVMINGLVGI